MLYEDPLMPLYFLFLCPIYYAMLAKKKQPQQLTPSPCLTPQKIYKKMRPKAKFDPVTSRLNYAMISPHFMYHLPIYNPPLQHIWL